VRILATVLTAALAAGALVSDVSVCRADAPRPAAVALSAGAPSGDALAARPGTEDEEAAYARREAESPDVQDYAGGFIVFLLVVVALVLIIILLAREL